MYSASFAGPARVVLAFALATFAAAPLSAQSDELTEKFKVGVDLYFRNKPDEALKVFQAVLAENPSNEQALRLYNEAGKAAFALMLEKGGEFESTAKRFLELATIGRKEKTDDAAAIGALVEKAMSDHYLDRRDALYELSANHGEYGAAPFVKFLGDEENQSRRANAVFCLIHLSGDAVLPLLAALEADNEMVVRNACACLGQIGDARAIPGLKQVAESAKNPVNQSAANEALLKVAGRNASTLPSSAELHIDAATRYFRNDQTLVAPFDTKDAVWNWSGDGVVATKVPAVLRHLRLAGQHCKAALSHPRAQTILIACYGAEKAAIADAKAMGAEGEAPEADATIDDKIAAGGPSGISAALTFALENDGPSAAVELLRALAATGTATDPVVAALNSPYKSVRYEAAFVLANTGDASDGVVRTLGQALAEDALRTVLVVDDRSESRNAMAAALRAAGYSVITAENGGIGFARARTVPPKDVVVVRAGMADVTIDQFVYDSDFRTAASSMVLVADATAQESLKTQYEGKGKVKAILSDPVTVEALGEAVKAAMPDLNHERAAALAAAERAAATLAHMPPASLAPVNGDLIKGLSRTEETVLGPTLRAVGRFGSAEALPAVSAIFADAARSEAIRVAAADALGGIFSKMTTAPAEDLLNPVKDAAAKETNAAVRLAAARALGAAAFLDPAQRAELLRGPK